MRHPHHRAAAPGDRSNFAIECARSRKSKDRGGTPATRRGIDTMTTVAVSPVSSIPQIQPANFLNLLIVDDDRTIREACREVAQSLGFNTQVAESAEHAYRLLDSSSTDAVLLDLRLPGAGGLEALHAIKKHR